MTHRTSDDAPLSTVAQALDAELRRYEELAAALEHEHLGSERNLRRAAQNLADLRTSDARLGECVQALVRAITTARERQQAQADVVQARAAAIIERTTTLTALTERWESLGRHAADVNRLAQRLLSEAGTVNGSGRTEDGWSTFREVDERLARLVADAEQLTQVARRERFGDLTAQAESLRQQLLAALDKVRRLRACIPSAG